MYDISQLLNELNPEFDSEIEISGDSKYIHAKRHQIIRLLQTLKERYKYIMLADITSADYEDRFEVIYHVMGEDAGLLGIKVRLDKADAVLPSAIPVWKAADVQEREIFDLMGIVFEGHDNLRRILCHDDFIGRPLRKDFKLKIADRFN